MSGDNIAFNKDKCFKCSLASLLRRLRSLCLRTFLYLLLLTKCCFCLSLSSDSTSSRELALKCLDPHHHFPFLNLTFLPTQSRSSWHFPQSRTVTDICGPFASINNPESNRLKVCSTCFYFWGWAKSRGLENICTISGFKKLRIINMR